MPNFKIHQVHQYLDNLIWNHGNHSFKGSQQEFDGVSISRGFPESDKFGLGYGHALSLE